MLGILIWLLITYFRTILKAGYIKLSMKLKWVEKLLICFL